MKDLSTVYDPGKKVFKFSQGISHVTVVNQIFSQFFNNTSPLLKMVFINNVVVENISGTVLRVFSKLINSLLKDVPKDTVPELILPEVDVECFKKLLELLLSGKTTLSISSGVTVKMILDLAACLQINMETLTRVGNEAKNTSNNTNVSDMAA